MKVTVQASRTVCYHQDIELSESAYGEFKKAVDSGNQQEIQEWLESRIDPGDVIEAEEFDVFNIIFL